jgi:hypothetical protein
MKDVHDKHTVDLAGLSVTERDPQGRVPSSIPHANAEQYLRSRPRYIKGGKVLSEADSIHELRKHFDFFSSSTFLPVSLVAKDWKVTPRRVRTLLAAGRLAGRQGSNGVWEVCFPYIVSEGSRGPASRRHTVRKAAPMQEQKQNPTLQEVGKS